MGKAADWIKNAFGRSKPPTGPNAEQLYGGPQAFSGYQPQAAQAQGNAQALQQAAGTMGQFQDIANRYNTQGLTQAQQGQLGAVMRQQQQAGAGARQAALQGAAARGTATGGAGLLAGLAGGANDANAAANAGAAYAAQMQQANAANQMAALGQVGNIGLGVNQATYGQNAQNAAAQDAFNQWAADMQAQARQQAYQNEVERNTANRRIWERLGQAGTNFANSWVSRSGNSGGEGG